MTRWMCEAASSGEIPRCAPPTSAAYPSASWREPARTSGDPARGQLYARMLDALPAVVVLETPQGPLSVVADGYPIAWRPQEPRLLGLRRVEAEGRGGGAPRDRSARWRGGRLFFSGAPSR